MAETTYKAGSSVEDLCRVCKELRTHTVIAVDANGRILRVICGFCQSQHNFRGGGPQQRASTSGIGGTAGTQQTTQQTTQPGMQSAKAGVARGHFPIVSEREREFPLMSVELPGGASEVDLEMLIRRVIREESGVTTAAPADKWRGGSLVLKPGKEGSQEKAIPIETFFNKIVMLRNRLRVLEQQVNSAEIPDELKLKLQGYITGCYGSLTTFNVLFAEEGDRFHGSGGDSGP